MGVLRIGMSCREKTREFYVCIALVFLLSHRLLGQDVTLPYTQSFDNTNAATQGALPNFWLNQSEGTTDLCSHTTNQDCYDWDVHPGPTVSGSTGPATDHTSGSGNYLFVEASGNANPFVRVHSPSFDFGGSEGYLSFWVHNYNGYTDGVAYHTLRLNVLNGATLATIASDILVVGEQTGQNNWVYWSVDLSTYKNSGEILIEFEWDMGDANDYRVDFSIDDIEIDVCSNTYTNLYDADFENTSGDNNWTLTTGASDGNFTIATPTNYTSGGTIMEIAAAGGNQALITGSANSQDLDGGPTTATSPVISLPATATSIILSLDYYFSHASNGATNDNLIIRVYDDSDDSILETIVSERAFPAGRDAIYTDFSTDLTAHAGEDIYLFITAIDNTSSGAKLEVAVDNVTIDYCTSGTSSEVCSNGSDDDGDGLVDCLDDDCDSDSSCDHDGDFVVDRLDLDDDNDGILDALECYSSSNLITNAGFESGNTGFSSDFSNVTCTSDCGPSIDVDRGEYAIYSNACGCGGQSGGVQEWTGASIEGDSFLVLNFNTTGTDDLWRQTVTTVAYREYSFNVWVLNINFSDDPDPQIQLAISTNGGSSYTVVGTSEAITESQGWTQIGFNFVNGNNTSLTIAVQNANSGNNGYDIAIDALSFIEATCDSDGDGVDNSKDLDSDNDGIYDVLESSSGQSQSSGVLTGTVDSDGIPSSVSNGSSYIDYQPADSDGDGLLDEIEIESDSDGCYDSFEENIADLDNDGTAGTGTPTVDSDGLVTSITYSVPTLNLWQSTGDINPACDGDTDDDGIPDITDLDDDNDGITDVDESPATIDFSGTKTMLIGTNILDMQVGDVVLYADAIRDCDDIFYDITITINFKSAGTTVDATTQGMRILNAGADVDDYFTFSLSVVESGSATVLNPTGTPATIQDFLFTPRDIDSNSAATGDTDIDHTEVFGIRNTTLPDSTYLDPLTVLEQGGFINGGGPGTGYTYYRMIPVSGPTDWSANDNDTSGEDERFAIFMFYENFSSVDIGYGRTGSATEFDGGTRLTSLFASKECDRDNDGIPNRVDLDLDNDGIYDLHEAGHTYTTDANGDGIIDGADTGSGANGLYDNIETSAESGTLNYTYSDSDSDGILYDFFESDSDDDNCFDTNEADVADADVDGIAGTGTPLVDAYGLVSSITYLPPPTTNWQNPLQSCLEICDNGIDDDGDGLIDEFDPDCADYFLEAECGFPGANWVRTFDVDASNNDFQTITTGLNSLTVPPTASADILRFTVTTAAAGTYRILGRVKSASGADDSFWFRVDEGTWYKWNDWDTGGTWQWIEFSDNDNGNNPVRYTLTSGNHSIDIAYREDGAGLDKLHLTINGSTPAGQGEESINCERFITTNLFLNYKIRNRAN